MVRKPCFEALLSFFFLVVLFIFTVSSNVGAQPLEGATAPPTVAEVESVRVSGLMAVFRMSILLVLGWVLLRLLKFGLHTLEQKISHRDVVRENGAILRVKTMLVVFRWLGMIAIVGMMLYGILETLGINVAPLLAGAGIVGLAFGFGGQYLIRDLINGIFILIEGQYGINDVVQIGEHSGLVEDVNLRLTTLRDFEGRVLLIPNGEVKTVINFTKDFAYAVLKIGVAYKEDIEKVMTVIKGIGQEMRRDPKFGRLIMEDLEMSGVDDLAESQVTILFRIKTLPIMQWEVAREIRLRVKKRFDELGIEIPFPQRTMYLNAPKDTSWIKALLQFQMQPRGESAQVKG